MYMPNLTSKKSQEQHEENIREYEKLKTKLIKIVQNDKNNKSDNNISMNDTLRKMNILMDDINKFRYWHGYDLEFIEL